MGVTDYPTTCFKKGDLVRYLKRDIGQRVVVQLATVTFTGTLAECGRDHITITDAAAGVMVATPADGRLVFPRPSIQFVQVLS